MTLRLDRRLISVSEYHKMGEVGILSEEDKVELLNGEIIYMSPINNKHSSHVRRLTALLYELIGKKATLLVQDPITIPNFSEPEPDITIAKLDANFYDTKNPLPKDIYILIEVSDSTLEKDRITKLPIYASAKIKEYWIVNLVDNCVEVYSNPSKDNYTKKSTFYVNDEIALTDFDLVIKGSDILAK